MPQSTNLNTPPYFEDFDPNKNFHKVLFRPGYPLQARELISMQSIMQDQIEKFGSSVYAEGAMVIPGRIVANLFSDCVLIENEYFGIEADELKEYLPGKIILGASTGVRAKVLAALTSAESEKGTATLYLSYLSNGDDSSVNKFADDEILITETAFSLGNTVIQENTDFAKCISKDSKYIGSTVKITAGIYFAKGYFVEVKEQEIILDQYDNGPSYKVGLQILEEIVVPENDTTLNDPSQGYSNFAAPGAHRFKLTAILTKKDLNDASVTDFIELLRLNEGITTEIVNDSKRQLAKTFESTFARRTYDESGDYVVIPFKYNKDECLDNGINNGVFVLDTTTTQGNTPSKDIFNITASPGKAYVRGYEIDKIGTSYIDIRKPRDIETKNNLTIRTDGRGVEFRTTTDIPYSRIAASFGQIVPVLDASDGVIGYAIFKTYSEESSYNIIRLVNIRFFNTATVFNDIKKIRFGGSIDHSNNTSSGGTIITLSAIAGKSKSHLFRVYPSVVKSVTDTKVQNVVSYYSANASSQNQIEIVGRNYYSTTPSDYTLKLDGNIAASISTINIAANGTLTLALTGATVASGTSYILIGPETIDNPVVKLASHQKMRILKLTDITNKYSINDSNLYLGTTRVSKIHAIYNPQGTISSPEDVLPKITLIAGTGSYKIGEVFIGRSTNAKGRVIRQVGNDIYFTYETPVNFVSNEEIFGYETGVERNIDNVGNNGGLNLKTRYILDDGQRDHTFEYSSIRKISTESTVSGDLYVVLDYFKDDVSSGQFYTVNSYYNSDFDAIPSYNLGGNKIYLTDFIDWRINKSDIFSSSTSGEYNNPFILDASDLVDDLNLGQYGSTVSNTYETSTDYVLPIGTTDGDVEYYLARHDNIYLSYDGSFRVQEGTSSLTPSLPSQELSGALKLLTIKMPAYLRDLQRVVIDTFDNKRFTMRDIGKLEKRITNIEYYTSLSLLETDTSNLFIDDGSGGNRLKNGFAVDNFLNHSVGDPTQPNYSCSLDMTRGHLRPSHYTTNIKLDQSDVPSKYIKGRYIMLDYDNDLFIDSPYAAIVENVNPFAVVTWIGILELSPETDDWFEENRIPDSVVDIEGNYTALVESMNGDPNTGLIPSQWGAWTTTETRNWSTGRRGGIEEDQLRISTNFTVTEEYDRQIINDELVSTQFAPWTRSRNITMEANSLKPGAQMFSFFGNRDVTAYTTPKTPRIVMTSGSVNFQPGEDVVLQVGIGRKFRATLLPANNTYASNYNFITSSYTQNSTYLNLDIISMEELGTSEYGGYLLTGDNVVGVNSGATATITSTELICDKQGALIGTFFIPNSEDDSNPRWSGGEVSLKFTGDPKNTLRYGLTDSAAESSYSSTGTTYTRQFDVENIRNADVVQEVGNIESQTVRTTTWVAPPPPPPDPPPAPQPPRPRRGDPLAQSFQVDTQTGIFLTQIDVFFQEKDNNIPLTCEVRNMINGYPGPNILDGMVKNPDDINVSEDAQLATEFNFETPIYLAPGNEYCFVLLTASTEYKLWISETGLNDLNGEKITKQPTLGSLFKSQNNSTWTTNQKQDIKFKIYRAKFKYNESPIITFSNDNSNISQFTKLRVDPIEINVNNGRIKVHHRNHGHHDNSSYVELRNVSSEQYASLNADFTGTPGTTISLKGNRDTFASSENINGAAPSPTNLSYIKLGDIIYTYDASSGVGTADGNGVFDLLTIDIISGIPPSDGFKSANGLTAEYYVIDGIPLTLINTIHTQLEWITADTYQINLSGITRNTPENITFGGTNVLASSNIIYTQMVPSVENRQYPGTDVRATFSGTSGTSLDTSIFSNPSSSTVPSQASYLKESSFQRVDLNNDNILNNPQIIASAVNEEKQMVGAKSAELRLQLSSSSDSLSPIILRDRISMTTTSNRIANFDGTYSKAYFENDATGTYDIGASGEYDYNPANYITKLFNLANPSSSLKIDFSAYNTTETNIDVYIKLLSGDEEDPNTIDWIEVTDTSYANRKSPLSFVDYSYQYDTTGSDTFTQYAVKIRMRSSNCAIVPLIKDFRCIALA